MLSSASSGCLLGTPSCANTRRRHAQHAAPRQACRASLCDLTSSASLVPLSHGFWVMLPSCWVRLMSYPFSCWWDISTDTRYSWLDISQPQKKACLCLLMGMYRYELSRAWLVAAGPSSRSRRSRLCRRTRTRKRSRGCEPRENTVRSWYQNVQRLMSCALTRGTTSI